MRYTLSNVYCLLFSLLGLSTFARAASVAGTILVFARDQDQAYTATSGLNGYGIPYQVVIVPASGITIPALTTGVNGNYGGIIVMGEVSYQYSDGFSSALRPDQWQQLFDYQTKFGVRMARLDAFPTPEFGTTPAEGGVGCCSSGQEQLLSFTDTSAFPTSGLKIGAGVSTQGLWHFPARITDIVNTKQIAKFGPGGPFTTDTTAAVINTNGARQQMVWFTGIATSWNMPSNLIQHSWIHWITRGLYVGFRRIYFSTQVDDVFLETELYEPQNTKFRVRPEDMTAHVSWTTDINRRLPAGSKYFVELAHNGNGNIEKSVLTDTSSRCTPPEAIWYDEQIVPPLEFKKPLGTGTNVWPTTPVSYVWSLECARVDPLLRWMEVKGNRDAFAHMSHTFTHENLNNATYSDTYKEITFNKAWMQQVGIASAATFSNGLVPPAITGLHNGDAIKAWMDGGVNYVVGDNTRPPLRNQESERWPLITTVERNGHAGLTVIPRWATTIFYNCDLPQCTLNEWIQTSGGSGDFNNLLLDAKNTNVRHLLNLNADPFMFHQANLRQIDAPNTTINGVSKKLSLLQVWVEVVLQEMGRLTSWPIVSLKHDAIGEAFVQRMTRDKCKPNLSYNLSQDGKSIVGVTVKTNGNNCGAKVPVTFPAPVTSNNGFTIEQRGSDPLTVWAQFSGSEITFNLQSPLVL